MKRNLPALKLLPTIEYTGVNELDPIKYYRLPVFGKLYRSRVEHCLAECKGGQSILEIGFGTGLTFLNLQEQYEKIYGLDLTADVDAISELFSRHQVETDLKNGSVLDMPYEDNAFDTVLLISILEHLQPEEQEIAFKEMRRVLKPGGQVVYGVPIERPLMVFLFRVLGHDIRQEHFSTELNVSQAAKQLLDKVRIINIKGIPAFTGAVYQVGHFVKAG
ncbi:MAG: class I SAM-dependent methyltransferase [Anaerolineaceae bacterium]|nr:class I SAM-dependent methyltransferase [Anaerolineaceae bacterium]